MAQASLTSDLIKKFKNDLEKDPKNLLALNTCTVVDPVQISISRKCIESTQHVFQHTVECAGKPMTDQKSAGSCWIYACLNVARVPFMKSLELEEFEFSQSHLFFWHKVEACNFWLNNIVKTAKEPIEGRLVNYILDVRSKAKFQIILINICRHTDSFPRNESVCPPTTNPTCDGGQWDMLVNLINKYGLIPKKCFPNAFTSEASSKMNSILKSVLRLYAKELREMVEKKASDAEIKTKIESQMCQIFKIISICFSIPPEKFTWEYTTKSKTNKIGPITPVDFYVKYVKPVFNFDDKVCLVNDPRPKNSYMTAYTVEYLGNMVGGRPIVYNNQPIELLLKLAADSIKNNEPVWFGCETGKSWSTKEGIGDLNLIDYNATFGLTSSLISKKSDRMIYSDSMMGHAMVLVGVSFDEKCEPTKFKVENSWGESAGKKGYHLITGLWFKEFVFEIVVDKKFLSKEVLDVFKQTPKILPAWDPMGTVAE